MNEISRTKIEYGGFLPLELNPGKEYFDKYHDNLSRFNSVKAAFAFLISKLECNKIYVPYYYCPSTIDAIRQMGIEVFFYHIDEKMLPISLMDEKESIVLLVDYFGTMGKAINSLARKLNFAEVIVDRAHAFFEKPIFKENIHNVYSAKKFFGVPDGAYLISSSINDQEQKLSSSTSYSGYLFSAYESGTNASYQEKKQADEIIANKYDSMSSLALGLLRNVDYSNVRKSRLHNYRVYFDNLYQYSELKLPKSAIAYVFPLLISRKGESIKHHLVEEKIYVPTLWRGQDLLENGNDFELCMARDAIFLPLDQRYSFFDIEYICSTVMRILEN